MKEKKEMMLGVPFGIKGKRIKMIVGDYKGQEGTITEETGYTDGYGVVVKIELDNGKTIEYDHSFFNIKEKE